MKKEQTVKLHIDCFNGRVYILKNDEEKTFGYINMQNTRITYPDGSKISLDDMSPRDVHFEVKKSDLKKLSDLKQEPYVHIEFGECTWTKDI